MSLFTAATNDQAYLKAGLFGQQASGKTYTASLMAIGLHAHLKQCGLPEGDNTVLFADTETGAAWVRPMFEEAGVKLEVAKTRAFSHLVPMIQEAETLKSILLIDSLTHFWQELLATYLKAKRRDRLVFSDWNWLKGPRGNGAFSEAYINASAHIIWCARAGFSYSYFENEAGQKELETTGVKAKAETESGYEPSLLIYMSQHQTFDPTKPHEASMAHYATVLKDRANQMDGKVVKNPKFEDFLPHIEYLALGGKQVGTTGQDSSLIIPPDAGSGRLRQEQRDIALDEIKELLSKHHPGMSAEAKRTKCDLLEKHLDTRSWARIQSYDLQPLQAAREQLWQELEGHGYDWQPPVTEEENPF